MLIQISEWRKDRKAGDVHPGQVFRYNNQMYMAVRPRYDFHSTDGLHGANFDGGEILCIAAKGALVDVAVAGKITV